MDKFGRNYVVRVSPTPEEVVEITLPFTLEIDVARNNLSSTNVCKLNIYNLSEDNRNKLRFNEFNYGQYIPFSLRAGYGDDETTLREIFQGNLSHGYSYRQGVDFITSIECFDGGFAHINGQTSTSFPAGTSRQELITTLATLGLPQTKIGAVGNYLGVLPRGNSFTGNTMTILNQLTGGGAFIDKGKLNALQTNEYIANSGGIPIITSATGLLGTPIYEQGLVTFTMLFEPALEVGQLVNLQSSVESAWNGQYIVTGIKHRGTISGAVCGDMITEGTFLFTSVPTPVTSGN